MANGLGSAVTQQTQRRWRFDSIPLVARLAMGFWIGYLCGVIVTFIIAESNDYFCTVVMVSYFLAPIGMLVAGCTKGQLCALSRLLALAAFCGITFGDRGGCEPPVWLCCGVLSGVVYGVYAGRSLIGRSLNALRWGFLGTAAALAGWAVWYVWVHASFAILMIVAMSMDMVHSRWHG